MGGIDLKSAMNKQKSRIKQDLEGDDNTKFFHACVKRRSKRNNIAGLMITGSWVTSPDLIHKEIYRYYSSIFSSQEVHGSMMELESPFYNQLSAEEAQLLEVKFTEYEVWLAVKSCDSSKAPGPDGFNFKFIKKFWDLIKNDLLEALNWFWEYEMISNCCNASFVTLVPKSQDPLILKDFQPISLIGVYYKIIAKVLAGRLKKVIGKLVSEEQNAFIHGRYILDGILVANETVEYLKKTKDKSAIFKIDVEKAYDKLDWDFLMDSMRHMDFGCKWRNWILEALKSASISILVNGSPTKEVKMERGVRQGDPLAPFLFVLAAEGFNQVCKLAIHNGLIKGVNVGKEKVHIFHLQYADDMVIFTKWERRNIKNILLLMKCFYRASGLKVNYIKSSLLGLSVSISEIQRLANDIGCQMGTFPLKYLGLQVGSDMNRFNNWGPVIEKFEKRLAGWKANALSFGGRLTLVNSILGSLRLYYFSMFRAPVRVIKTLERVRRDFFWGGGLKANPMTWVKWSNVTKSRDFGGLNIISLKSQNMSLLGKWWWRFRVESGSLWVRVIKSLYGSDGGMGGVESMNKIKGGFVWSNIIRVGRDLQKIGINWIGSFQKKVGNGENTQFWLESWFGGVQFSVMFPRLFKLSKNVSELIEEKNSQGDWVWHWDWARLLRGRTIDEFQNLKALLESFSSGQEAKDRLRWNLVDYGLFEVKKLERLIEQRLSDEDLVSPEATRWMNTVPKKVCIFIWRAQQGRLPVRVSLDHRGVDIPSLPCPLCEMAIENSDHVLVKCQIAADIWSRVLPWWRMDPPILLDVHQILNLANSQHWRKESKLIFEAVIWCFLFFVWKCRNTRVFEGKQQIASDLFFEFQWRSFLWIKARCKGKNWSWHSWIHEPRLLRNGKNNKRS